MSVREKAGAVRFRRVRCLLTIICAVASCALLASSAKGLAVSGQQPTQSASAKSSDAGQQNPSASPESRIAHLPRGKKLILKDGNVQLVREYQVMDDRVRFYNIERSQWEEMPAALVDWDATKQSEADQKKNDAALLSSVHKQEQARRIMPLDVDASLEAAPGVFIPPGEGLFVYDGKSVLRLTQAQADNKRDKAKVVEQVLVPIPVVPSRRNLSIPRPHAEVRVHNEQPEFYMRTADGREPNMILIRTKVHGDSRLIENVDTYLEAITKTKRNEVIAERWQIANGVYRFTLSQSLEPGEYVFTEIVKGEGTNLYVWDFGVDVGGKVSAAKK
ncbi:MAG: hypothetical protein WB723_12240 [Candidatus Acidiferrales bacterium]